MQLLALAMLAAPSGDAAPAYESMPSKKNSRRTSRPHEKPRRPRAPPPAQQVTDIVARRERLAKLLARAEAQHAKRPTAKTAKRLENARRRVR